MKRTSTYSDCNLADPNHNDPLSCYGDDSEAKQVSLTDFAAANLYTPPLGESHSPEGQDIRAKTMNREGNHLLSGAGGRVAPLTSTNRLVCWTWIIQLLHKHRIVKLRVVNPELLLLLLAFRGARWSLHLHLHVQKLLLQSIKPRTVLQCLPEELLHCQLHLHDHGVFLCSGCVTLCLGLLNLERDIVL